ncbi:hypothetical protein GCM10017781_08570 [Deinococcus metalli]|nr:hypothetical protein GCM10017781_08570 [Deinococcus metalli]
MYGRSLRGQTEGFALVLSLLFTGIVLLIVVSTAASLVTGTRQGGANERVGYQALLVAESGLNSLPRRSAEYVRTTPYIGASQTELQSWLTGSSSPTNAGGLRAALNDSTKNPATGDTIVSLTAQSATTFTAVSTGTSSTGTKTILQDYAVTDRTLPPGLRPRSGLISRPPINTNGNATVQAQNVNNTVTTVSGAAVNIPALTTSATVPVVSSAGLTTGDYVKISGSTFKISAISGNVLTVIRVPGASSTAQTLSGNVDVVLNAVSQSYTGVTSSTAIKVSNIADYAVGEIINIGSVKAKIATIDYSSKTVTLTWTGSPPSSIDEGTPVTRDVTALSSGSDITLVNGKVNNFKGISGGALTNDCADVNGTIQCAGAKDTVLANAGATQTSTSLSFTQLLFGMTDEELSDLVPLTTSNFPTLSGGIMRIRGSDLASAIKGKNSTGVLIVDGDVDQNINASTTFNGLIYIRGNLIGFGNGNFTVNGSVAVRGSNTMTTSTILGSLAINYNAVTLRTVLQSATGSKKLNVISGTWRQQ